MTTCNPSHFYWPVDWSCKTFLPFFRLVWCDDMPDRFCRTCPLSSYAHPMVREAYGSYTFRKLCTLHVVKNGLMKLKEVFSDKYTCNFDANPIEEYKMADKIIKKLIINQL